MRRKAIAGRHRASGRTRCILHHTGEQDTSPSRLRCVVRRRLFRRQIDNGRPTTAEAGPASSALPRECPRRVCTTSGISVWHGMRENRCAAGRRSDLGSSWRAERAERWSTARSILVFGASRLVLPSGEFQSSANNASIFALENCGGSQQGDLNAVREIVPG